MSQPPARFRAPHPATTAPRAVAAACLCLLAGLMAWGLAPAASAQDESDLARAESELAATRDRIDATTADLSTVRERIQLITDDLADAERHLAAVEEEVETTEAQIRRLTLEALDLQETVGLARERIQSKARALYTNGPDAPFMELFETTTAERAIDRAAVMSRLADGDRSVAEEADADRARLEVVSAELDRRNLALADLRAEADARRAQVDANLDEAEELRAGLAERVDELSGAESELAGEIDRIEQAIAERKAREEAARRRAAEEAAAREAAEREAAAKAAEEAAAAEAAREAAEEEEEEEEEESSSSSTSSSSSSSSSSDDDDDDDDDGGSSGGGSSTPTGGLACPLNGVTLYNDWGAPRGGGSRSHEGNDLVGSYRQNVYAITSGTWDVYPYGNSAGLWAILRGDDGNEYWYLHLDEHYASDGEHVSTGETVAANGNTGNASGGVHHVHFEYHPGGGGPSDPYPLLSGPC